MIDVQHELYGELSRASSTRLGFTRRAFEMLPEFDRPRILDVGCGQGGPTLELARLSNGEVVGLDIDQASLGELARRIREEGLSDRVRVVNGSMLDMDFPHESFDIIWSEGSMHVIGFERALDDWRRFIKQGGFLVVHETAWLRPDPPTEIATCSQLAYPGIRTIPEYAELVPGHGYDLLGHFVLPEGFWWLECFEPLERRIRELRGRHAEDRAVQKALDREQQGVNLFRKHSAWYGSAFLVMQKRNHCERST